MRIHEIFYTINKVLKGFIVILERFLGIGLKQK
jgi:hypothetical protein